MSYPGSGVWARRTSAAAALVVLACGSARSTPYYEAPRSLHGASASGSGTLDGQGDSGGVAGTTLVATGGTGETGAAGASVGGRSSAGATTTGGASGNAGTGTGGVVALGGSSGDTLNAGEAGSSGSDAGGAGAPSADCAGHDASAHDFDGHCYLYRPDAMTWRDASDDCESRGAHLVTISSEGRSLPEFLAENAFVWQLTGASPSWLDATDGKGPHQKGDGTYFKWNTGEAMTLDNWSSGQPNNSSTSCDGDPCSCDQGSCYEHCGFQWENPGREMDSVPGWNDRLCEHRIGFVCEWEK